MLENNQLELEIWYMTIKISTSMNSEERLSKLEDRAEDIILNSTKNIIELENIEVSLGKMEKNVKPNIGLIRVPGKILWRTKKM